MVGLPFHVLEAADPARLEDSLRALDLVVADFSVARGANLRPDRARSLRSGGGRRFGVRHEHADLRRRVVVRAHRRRETPLSHRAIESRRAPRAEHAGEQLEGGRVSVVRPRRAPAERELRLRDVAREVAIAEPPGAVFTRAGRTRRIAGGEAAVSTIDVREHCVGIDVADDREDCVAGAIKVAIEADHIVLSQRAQPRLAADAPAADAMPVVEQLVQRLRRDGRRVVGFALGLLDDHLELARQLAAVDQRVRVGVCLDVEPGLQARRRKDGVVARVIVDRAGVQIAAGRLRFLGDLADAAGRRALEVHVLEHVRDSDDVVRLVEIAGADERDDGDDRRRRIAAHEHGQPVR